MTELAKMISIWERLTYTSMVGKNVNKYNFFEISYIYI